MARVLRRRYEVLFSIALWDAVREAAEMRKKSVGWIVRDAVKTYLANS
jgi:hypothetical protein